MEQRHRTLEHPVWPRASHPESAQPFLVGKEHTRVEALGNDSTRRPERQLAIELR